MVLPGEAKACPLAAWIAIPVAILLLGGRGEIINAARVSSNTTFDFRSIFPVVIPFGITESYFPIAILL